MLENAAMKPNPLFCANWKMNMLQSEAKSFCEKFLSLYSPRPDAAVDVGIAPPLTCLPLVKELLRDTPGIMVGSQNVHWLLSGAHTGEVSGAMLKEVGAEFAIIGHSERRQFYGETDKGVSLRAKAAIDAELKAIVCVGELREEFEQGKTELVVETQLKGSLKGLTEQYLDGLIIAYEPVWAIGTGLAATPEIAEKVQAFIRRLLCEMYGEKQGNLLKILYGGSTTPSNIGELASQPNVNGGLVGGASLKPDVFWELIKTGREVSK